MSSIIHKEEILSEEEYARNLKRATLASSAGSALEYYDFAIYGLASALIFSKLFFPALPHGLALIASFATFGVGFLARPIGGIFFGIMGDKLGRKWVLLVTIALMGGASTLIGLLPTGDSIGYWAPILLVFLRLCQGFGAGAEQAGATVLMAEYAPAKQRGFLSALPFIGIYVGTLLAAVVFALISLAPEEMIYSWLWRVPFLVSIALILIALWIRVKLKESPTFVNLEKHEQIKDHPFTDMMKNSKKNVLIGIGLRMAENGGSYLFQALAISFAVHYGVSQFTGSIAVAISSIIGIFTVPYAGYISDKIGRKKVYRVGAAILLILAVPGWYLLSLGSDVITCIVITLGISFSVCIMLGAQCAMLPEFFGNSRRYICVASAREFSAILAGGLAPVLGAFLFNVTDYAWWPISIYVAILACITLYAVSVAPETQGRDLNSLEDAK